MHGRYTCLKFSLCSATNSSNCWAPFFVLSFPCWWSPWQRPSVTLPPPTPSKHNPPPLGPNIQHCPTHQPAAADRTEPVALPVAELFALWLQCYLAAKPVIITQTCPLFHLRSWQTWLWPLFICVCMCIFFCINKPFNTTKHLSITTWFSV